MTNNLSIFLSRFANLSNEELDAFVSIFKPISINKYDHLFLENEMLTKIYYIDDGMLRGYYNKQNVEITTHFYFGPTILTDLIAVREKSPTKLNVQALKQSNCMVAEFSDLDLLIDNYKNIEEVFFKFLEIAQPNVAPATAMLCKFQFIFCANIKG